MFRIQSKKTFKFYTVCPLRLTFQSIDYLLIYKSPTKLDIVQHVFFRSGIFLNYGLSFNLLAYKYHRYCLFYVIKSIDFFKLSTECNFLCLKIF